MVKIDNRTSHNTYDAEKGYSKLRAKLVSHQTNQTLNYHSLFLLYKQGGPENLKMIGAKGTYLKKESLSKHQYDGMSAIEASSGMIEMYKEYKKIIKENKHMKIAELTTFNTNTKNKCYPRIEWVYLIDEKDFLSELKSELKHFIIKEFGYWADKNRYENPIKMHLGLEKSLTCKRDRISDEALKMFLDDDYPMDVMYRKIHDDIIKTFISHMRQSYQPDE